MVVQGIEAVGPELPVVGNPCCGSSKRLGLQVAEMGRHPARAGDQSVLSSTFKCLEIAGCDTGNGAANSATVASLSARRTRIDQRAGSASKPNTMLSESASVITSQFHN